MQKRGPYAFGSLPQALRVLLWAGILLFDLVPVMPLASQAAQPEEVSTLSQLSALSPQQLAGGLPFKLEGTVLCYDADWHQLFLQTSGKTVYVPPHQLRAQLKPGDLVRITGVTVAVQDSFPVTNLEAVVLGHAALPPARSIELRDLAATAGEWVEILAPVRAADVSRERLGLTLGGGSESCVAYAMGGALFGDPKRYVGGLVRVRGINTSQFISGHISEASLLVPDASQVMILERPPTPLDRLPVVSIDALFNRELGPWTNQPVHLSGFVVSSVPGDELVLRDPTGILRARTRQVSILEPGERIHLWGYLDGSAGQSVLADACFESAAPKPAPEAPLSLAPVLTNVTGIICTNIAGLRGLSRERLTAGVQVKFRGVVIYSDPEWHTAFVYEPRAAVYAELNQSDIVLGERVELTGQANLGSFGPAVRSTRFEALGSGKLPSAVAADLEDIADGSLDAQWVELRGVIRRASAEWGHLHLSVMSLQGKFEVVVPGFSDTNPPVGLLGSRVAIIGVCGSNLNARNQVAGVTLYTPSLRQIKMLEATSEDPFATKSVPISDIATFNPQRMAGERVKVTGVVTLTSPGQGFYLQDASGGIRVESQAAEIHCGEFLEVLGFPALGDFSPHLEETVFKRLGTGRVPVPRGVTADQLLLEGNRDGCLVRLEARLLQPIPRATQPKLMLQQDSIIFSAQLIGHPLPERVFQWRAGSRLRLTGVCAIQGTENHLPQSLRLLLSNPEQLELLQPPPILSLRDLLLVGAALGVCGLLTFSWIATLRRQVRVRTADLRASQVTLQRQFEGSQALSELGRRLNAAASPKDAALIIVDVADRLIGWDCCICDLYSSETNLTTHVLNIDLIDGHRCECQPNTLSVPPSGLALRAIESGPQLLLRTPADLAQPALLQAIPFGDTTRRSASLLYVPIRNGASTVGVLSIQSYESDAFDREDLTRLQDLADHCSGALDRIRAHQQLLEFSRHAGMAEIATGVIHNVGNVLNSVNVSVTLMLNRAKNSAAARLAQVSDLLKAHAADLPQFLTEDPKGRKLPAFIDQLAQRSAQDEREMLAELESVGKHVEHIKEIVAMQQSYARLAGVVEKVPVTELVEDALRLNAGTLCRHQIAIRREFGPHLPTLVVDKHKVLQILINLIRNAKYACDEAGRNDKQVTLRIANGADRVRISVADNGVGIPRENLTRIFNLGFTTRRSGHGFGLHNGALTAKELGGELTVQSDGPGTGATFTLELPVSEKN